jgi:regulator of replication initiation timing
LSNFFKHTPKPPEYSPFATDSTASELHQFDHLDRALTEMMTEKTHLDEEASRLHQRGGKTLKERTRLKQVEARLKGLGKEISDIRRELSLKPG